MTLDEYMDKGKFPVTTQDGLKPSEQLFIDAYNYDALKEKFEAGKPLTDVQGKALAEFEEKMKEYDKLVREAAAQEGGGAPAAQPAPKNPA